MVSLQQEARRGCRATWGHCVPASSDLDWAPLFLASLLAHSRPDPGIKDGELVRAAYELWGGPFLFLRPISRDATDRGFERGIDPTAHIWPHFSRRPVILAGVAHRMRSSKGEAAPAISRCWFG
jgi:hypothetical protein